VNKTCGSFFSLFEAWGNRLIFSTEWIRNFYGDLPLFHMVILVWHDSISTLQLTFASDEHLLPDYYVKMRGIKVTLPGSEGKFRLMVAER